MEGAGIDAEPVASQKLIETILQLPGGFVGEGDCQHVPGAHPPNLEHPLELLFLPGGGFRRGAEEGQILRGGGGGELLMVGVPIIEQAGNPVHQDSGFSAAGPCQDQQRAFDLKDRLFLHGVHSGEPLLQHGSLQLIEFFCELHLCTSVSWRKARCSGLDWVLFSV